MATTSQEYTLERKTGANTSEEVQIPAGSVTGLATVATSGSYNDLSDKPTIPQTFDDLARIKKHGYAGNNNAVQYFKLATFPEYNSKGNYASFIVTGRMGGWEAGNMSFVNMILYNRGAEGGGYINVDNSAFFNLCDIVMYRETSGASTAYLKVKGYYTFDINVNAFQATKAYTGTAVTPTGTLQWTASTQADRLAVSDGKAYINGFTMPKQVKVNGVTHNPDSDAVIDLGTAVTTDTEQEITGLKSFNRISAKDIGLYNPGDNSSFSASDGGDTSYFSVNSIKNSDGSYSNNIEIGIDANCELALGANGNPGTSGQVLTSQGAGNTPIWADVSGGGSSDNSKHGYTQLTNENLNTITEVGWYRAENGNTCTNRPNIGNYQFILVVEKATASHIRQTIYKDVDMAYSYTRYSLNSGSTWLSWTEQQTLTNSTTQYFSGRKSFSGGINVGASLQVGGSNGNSGQVLMAQGSTAAPKWTNLQVKVNGTTYTADSSGLIDLGEISGGTTAVAMYNDIY